ncbi:hypothetical protein M758_8G106200 [Ceratodon purpureus]|nr:hypothetical protein M758_8G106200 [Ceratodon purpureus]
MAALRSMPTWRGFSSYSLQRSVHAGTLNHDTMRNAGPMFSSPRRARLFSHDTTQCLTKIFVGPRLRSARQEQYGGASCRIDNLLRLRGRVVAAGSVAGVEWSGAEEGC